MSRARLRRNHGLRILLAIAWLPYLVLCCCPNSVSAFLRCGSTNVAHAAEPDSAAHHEGHCARADAGDSADHGPEADCCSYRDDGDSTPVSAFVMPPPALPALWVPLPILREVAVRRIATELIEQHEHSPPVYLSTLTLLL